MTPSDPPAGTRNGDRSLGALGRVIKVWPIIVTIGGVFAAYGAARAAFAADHQQLQNVAGEVAELKAMRGELQQVQRLADRLDERTGAMKTSIDRIESVVAPRNPNERVNMTTRDTRTQP
jgi:hypothetical protein